MTWVLLVLLPVTAFAGLDMLCRGAPPVAVRRLLRLPWSRLLRLPWFRPWRRVRAHPPERLDVRQRPAPVDVFDTLRLQARLGAVADEILRLESDRTVFARAHRLRATRRAYDELLVEACRLAGIGEPGIGDPTVGGEFDDERATAELELASRGWSW